MNGIAYSFNPETLEYTGPVMCQASPREKDVFWMPAHAIETVPPTPGPNQTVVQSNGSWAFAADYRGQPIYNQTTGLSQVVAAIGEIPSGWMLTPKPVTLDEAKTSKLAQINSRCTTLLNAVKSGYPDDEVQSWGKQENEARAYVVNNSSTTPLLSALATARGVPLTDVVANVIQKADLFTSISGQIIGTRQKYKDQINAAADIPAVQAITWP